ncbi:hypothetical protein JIN85_17405 [Luteolibacter pohnpeiensis]|uniref:Sialate O-acetylesterase domain-containing protein n=1 Tax=Luteolibacter pohnpeiensis TaxID=454153 RepID=A0A934S6X3_9BACT|nr:glycoside hydrolase family 76 protein [Luteolibacter pohnpeiensis]MBK1884200.1 hypothetical protein [Luteolibacter pohnpeiensis]
MKFFPRDVPAAPFSLLQPPKALFRRALDRCMRRVAPWALMAAMVPHASAFEAGDADTIYNAYVSAFLGGSTRNGYFKENTDGGHAWFWGQANMMEMVSDAYDRTGSTAQKNLLSGLCAGFNSYHGTDWSWNEYNDDIMWACIVFSKAYLASGNTSYKQQVISNFDKVWQRGWSDDLGGGMWWRTDNQSKNACDNCPAAIVACLLYEITGDESYLDKAKMLMAWMNANLVTSEGAVNDHMNLSGEVVGWLFSYNQGTYVGASNYLYKLTGDQTYLNDALKATRFMRDHLCDANGIFPNHGTGGGDGSGFNGVGIRWITKFVHDQGLWSEFYPWLKANADAAWNIRRSDNLSWSDWRNSTPSGVLAAFECYGSATALQVVPAEDPSRLSLDANVPEASADNYQILYSLNLPTDGAYVGSTPVPYSVDNSASVSDFDRVAYYLELTTSEGVSQWVYASMDAFTEDPVKLGLPHNINNPVLFQQPVRNLNVLSNVAGVVTGDFMEGGNIEMWPSNYDMGNGAGIYAASGSSYDWGDTNGNTGSGYGSFQVHNAFARQTVFAYNHWGAGGQNDDLGIGSQSTGHPDWTFAANAGGYTARKMLILVRPKVARVTLAEFPKNRSLYPRDVLTNQATVPVSGTVDATGSSKAILRIYRDGELTSTLQQMLFYPAEGGAPFSFSPTIPAEAANYTFELSTSNASGETLIHRATEVVAGDVLMFYGQSNMEAGRSFTANNQSSEAYYSPFVRTFGQNADSGTATRNNTFWVPAEGDGAGSYYVDPGAVGQWAIVVGRKIFDDYGIPVALMNGARGGYSMAQLQKDDANPDALDDSGQTRTYNRLRFRAIQAGVAAKARAMFYYQGEAQNDDAASYAEGWQGLWDDWKVDYPALEHIYQVQVRPGCGVTVGDVSLRQLQRTLGDVYPNTSVTTGNGLSAHDGCHYNFIGGYEQIGLQHYHQLARDLYGAADEPNLDPLNPAKVEFADASRKLIRIEMRDPEATIDCPLGALIDFTLVGSPGKIVDRTVSGNTLILELDQPADSSAVLGYRGHLGEGEWITNGMGLGMLAFSEPVTSPGPLVTFVTPATTMETGVGTPITIEATASAGTGGEAVKMIFYANGVPQFETAGSSLNTTWTAAAPGAYRLSVVALDAEGESGSASVAALAGSDATPGGVGSGLTAWFRADAGVVRDANGAVSQWLDQSGNGHNATQVQGYYQPHFSEGVFGTAPGITFDGSDFLGASSGMPTGSYTKVVRFKATSAAFNNNLISSDISNNSSGDHALYVPALVPSFYHAGQRVNATAALAPNADTVLMATYESSRNTAKLYVNGVLAATGTMALDNTISSFQIGAFANSNFLYGAISEAMIYDRVLSDVELGALTTYLSDRLETPFRIWQSKASISRGTSPAADSDGDGYSDLMEYAFGMDPSMAESGAAELPHFEVIGDEAVVTYYRPTDRPDVMIQLEGSTDLIHWSPLTDDSMGITAGFDMRQLRESVTSGNDRSKYYRIQVSQP